MMQVNPVVLVVFIIFAVFVFSLVVRAFILQWTRKTEPFAPPSSLMDPSHVHEWRHVTEYVKQCRVRACAEVRFEGDVPDGMHDYVRLMTTRQARIDPNGEAGHYKESDPKAWGMSCPICGRVIPMPEELPQNPFLPVLKEERCPFCQNFLYVKIDTNGKRYYANRE